MGNNNQNTDALINSLASKLNLDPEKLKESVQNGSLESIFKNMNPEQAQQIQQIAKDKNAAQKLLSSPQAQALIKKLQNNK